MKISTKILSIPPYISTSWDNVSSLHVREENSSYRLTIILKDGSQTTIPGLDKQQLDIIFAAHARFLENKTVPKKPTPPAKNQNPLNLTLPLSEEGINVEAFGPSAKHNPEQANLPPLPKGILDKLAALAKSFGLDNFSLLPKGEPNCNCIHCQVMNAMHSVNEMTEELVSEEDLKFRDWDIQQTAEHLYIVTNPLDAKEYYSVFLGSPIGCTCGSKDCEHIRAVLKS